MALFSRRREPEPVDEVEEPPAAGTGPFDVEDVPDLGGRIDLGALRIPPRPGMQVRVELDRATRKPVSLTLTDGASALQLQVYAAPRSASLWDEIRPELAQSIEDRSGTSDDVPGVFGRELLARMPVTTQGGSGMRVVRFVGIDGPRWMIGEPSPERRPWIPRRHGRSRRCCATSSSSAVPTPARRARCWH